MVLRLWVLGPHARLRMADPILAAAQRARAATGRAVPRRAAADCRPRRPRGACMREGALETHDTYNLPHVVTTTCRPSLR